jgi:hypothetical protein
VTVNSWARLLFIIGALLAITGGAVAVLRSAAGVRAAKRNKGTFADFNDANDPVKIRARAIAEAKQGVVEFVLVGLGVTFSAAASLILIPND